LGFVPLAPQASHPYLKSSRNFNWITF